MLKPPCKKDNIDCPKRTLGCHSTCKEYIAFKRANAEEANARRKQKQIEDQLTRDEIRRSTKGRWH